MIKAYRIVQADNVEEVEKEVFQLIKEGWTLQGGVACIPETDRSHMRYMQAMIDEWAD